MQKLLRLPVLRDIESTSTKLYCVTFIAICAVYRLLSLSWVAPLIMHLINAQFVNVSSPYSLDICSCFAAE